MSKYIVGLHIYPEPGSEGGHCYWIDKLTIDATTKEEAIKKYNEIKGEPSYFYPSVMRKLPEKRITTAST